MTTKLIMWNEPFTQTLPPLLIFYIPLVVAILLYLNFKKSQRLISATIIIICWQIAIIPILNTFAVAKGYWLFNDQETSAPIWLILAWTILWGPCLLAGLGLFSRLYKPIVAAMICTAFFGILDILIMPELHPIVTLKTEWLYGELLMILFSLIPGLWIIHIFWIRKHPRMRGFIAAIIFTVLLLIHTPALTVGYQHEALLATIQQFSHNLNRLSIIPYIILFIPAAHAVNEFAVRGRGTPLPFDPPKHLITHSIYAYCRNPMQKSILLICCWHAFTTNNVWMLVTALVSLIYCQGIAKFSEQSDLNERFQNDFLAYSSQVKRWWCRLRPAETKGMQANIYFDYQCGVCREIKSWFEKHDLVGLKLKDANTLPAGKPDRVRYVSEHFTIEGPLAIAYALQHIHIGWAYIGWIATLPGIDLIVNISFEYKTQTLKKCRP